MIDADPIQSFDLPDDCRHDHVVIYPNDAPKDPHFYAVPFDYLGTDDDGDDHYEEPFTFEVTEQYREAVSERADVSIDEIKLRRDDLPVTTLPDQS
jgi:hypothetical protein